MKFIGIDYGTKKIGIALSDGLGMMAFPKFVLRYTSRKKVIAEIINLCTQYGVQGVVIGIPFYRDGTISPLAKEVYTFLSSLQKQFEAFYFTINEYLTSFEAKAIAPQKEQENAIDAYSAQIILEDFLSLSDEKRAIHRFLGEA